MSRAQQHTNRTSTPLKLLAPTRASRLVTPQHQHILPHLPCGCRGGGRPRHSSLVPRSTAYVALGGSGSGSWSWEGRLSEPAPSPSDLPLN
eukprot:scaffold305327_cov37-Tisochrysis_lutea.AAC.1